MKIISKLFWFSLGFSVCFALFTVREPIAAKRVGTEISEKATKGAELAKQGVLAAKMAWDKR